MRVLIDTNLNLLLKMVKIRCFLWLQLLVAEKKPHFGGVLSAESVY